MTLTIDAETIWAGVGLVGQGIFTSRLAVQWLASERKKDVVVPDAFWWFSLAGGLITLVYAIHLQSLSLALAQSTGVFIYMRNLMLIAGRKRRDRAPRPPEPAGGGARSALSPHARIDAGRPMSGV